MEDPVKGSVHILVVDDEEGVRKIINVILKQLGYKVTLCPNGREALGYYRKAWSSVDLVILDMMMPDMGGVDTFLAMKAINPSICAIISTGNSIDDVDAKSMLDAGVKRFIQKPFHLVDFSRAIAEVLQR